MGALEDLLGAKQARIQRQLLQGSPRPAACFSWGRMLHGMGRGDLSGFERELLEGVAGLAGEAFDPQRVRVPWELMGQQRTTLVAATGSAGGDLIATTATSPTDILRGFSVVAQSGIMIASGLSSNTTYPRTTTAPQPYVLADENTAITRTNPVLGVSSLTPHNVGVYVEWSRQLAKESPLTDRYISTILLGAIGEFTDYQCLQGVGTAGAIKGLFNLTGVQSQSGTSLAFSGCAAMAQVAAEAGAKDEEVGWITTPAVRKLLQTREKGAGDRYIWDADQVCDRPARASNDCPSGSMIIGPWSRAVLGIFGPGPQIEVNPYGDNVSTSNFQTATIGARVLLSIDLGVVNPASFVKTSSVT